MLQRFISAAAPVGLPAFNQVPPDFPADFFRFVQRHARVLPPFRLTAFHVFADLFLGLLRLIREGHVSAR